MHAPSKAVLVCMWRTYLPQFNSMETCCCTPPSRLCCTACGLFIQHQCTNRCSTKDMEEIAAAVLAPLFVALCRHVGPQQVSSARQRCCDQMPSVCSVLHMAPQPPGKKDSASRHISMHMPAMAVAHGSGDKGNQLHVCSCLITSTEKIMIA